MRKARIGMKNSASYMNGDITDDQREAILRICMGCNHADWSVIKIAEHFQVSPDTVKELFRQYLERNGGRKRRGKS
jgi:AraC-like DNA-binding protein